MEPSPAQHPVELVFVANVDLLKFEPVRFRNRSEVLKVARVGELVNHADGVRCVVDDMPSDSRPDKSGSACYDNTVHKRFQKSPAVNGMRSQTAIASAF